MIRISAVIITYNEEKNIARCLQSLQGVADEIIVIDSFSTDATKTACEPFHPVFRERVFDSFSAQKNAGNALATGDYILSLDADEALSEDLRNALLEFKKEPDADILEVNRVTNYCGHWVRFCGWYPDAKIRCWKKEMAWWDDSMVHEDLHLAEGATQRRIKKDILHYSYYSVREHLERTKRYARLGARELFASGKRISLFMILIKTLSKFIRNYIILLGFLDGYYGFIICRMAAYETYLKYALLRRLHQGQEI